MLDDETLKDIAGVVMIIGFGAVVFYVFTQIQAGAPVDPSLITEATPLAIGGAALIVGGGAFTKWLENR
ncbi:hypothetical protein [Halopelagius longus]|uniref:Uncharacterized protein n=1 Tax=Halopelagius longus TaxID=1236180 RepID=A0A1H0YWJ3_9EURY|nr:hypothetical protein [Halopelagius longus]RDI72712.1 hypothetical protein DWB78_13815 [Halopelagius longus]SDQ19559.1 hypothetical protein SAMN05216278_0883 [Halopelagius longus]